MMTDITVISIATSRKINDIAHSVKRSNVDTQSAA